MKKMFNKKLSLNKATITRLQSDEMKVIIGASIVVVTCDCDTASCSIHIRCCDPETNEILLKKNKG